MKNTKVSILDLEVLNNGPLDLPEKPTYVSEYGLEVLNKTSLQIPYKPTYVADYCLEILQGYTPLAVEPVLPDFKFSGTVHELTTPVARQLFAYDQVTYVNTGEVVSTASGTFDLYTSFSGTGFVVCLDDEPGTSYNHLVLASVVPLSVSAAEGYGLTIDNPASSALDIKQQTPSSADGLYWIQPEGYAEPVQIYCDMTTQGGGWMLCARWDRDFPVGWEQCMPLNAFRSDINIDELKVLNSETDNQAATLNIIPFIAAGSTMFMHTSMDIYDTVWKYMYFSEIYQDVLDDPDRIFDISFDTNDAEAVEGAVVGFDANLKNRWFDYDMSLLSELDLQGSSTDYRLSGGEGTTMFTNGSRNGAVYCSHSAPTCEGHHTPYVCWGFYGKDGSVMDYGYAANSAPRVGTSSSSTAHVACRFNFMFIR